MQSKVLCLLFVTLVAGSVTAGIISDAVSTATKTIHGVSRSVSNVAGTVNNSVANAQKNLSNAQKNSSNALQNAPVISLPSILNDQLPDVVQGVEAAEQLLRNVLGGVGNLADIFTNLIGGILKGAQPLVDLVAMLVQILEAFGEAASKTTLSSGVLILQNGLQLIDVILRSVMNVI